MNGGHGLIPHKAIRIRKMRSNVVQDATISDLAKRDNDSHTGLGVATQNG